MILPPAFLFIKNQQAPAAIVPTDLRACQVNSASTLSRMPVIPEKRAGLGRSPKMLLSQKRALLSGSMVTAFFHRYTGS